MTGSDSGEFNVSMNQNSIKRLRKYFSDAEPYLKKKKTEHKQVCNVVWFLGRFTATV